jgi:hypothetical protein
MALPQPQNMNESELREEISLWLYTLAHWLSRDTTAYFYIKRMSKIEDYKGIGGGNMLVALGCFSCLEFFSGIYAHLTTQKGLWSKAEASNYIKIRNKAIKLGLSEQEIKKIIRPKPIEGSIKNACVVVRELILVLEKDYKLSSGLPAEDEVAFCKLWNAFRNNLAHTMSPALGTSVSSSSTKDIKELRIRSSRFKKDMYLSPGPSFNLVSRDGITRWEFAADLFAMGYMIRVADYLRHKTGNCQDKALLQTTLEFIRGEELVDSLL